MHALLYSWPRLEVWAAAQSHSRGWVLEGSGVASQYGWSAHVVAMDFLTRQDDVQKVLRHGPTGLFVDIDGTLTPIASTPSGVSIAPGVQRTLERLSHRMAVVALTGRSVADARRILGLDTIIYAGNHGLEWWEHGTAFVVPEAMPYMQRMGELAKAADRRFADLPGILVEKKGPTISLHYRQTADPPAAREAILQFLTHDSQGQGMVRREGKMVVEVRPPVNSHKGTALMSVVERLALRSALVFGDDVTDVDAFEAVRKLRRETALRGITVAVLGDSAPAELTGLADYDLPDTEAVALFLSELLEASLGGAVGGASGG